MVNNNLQALARFQDRISFLYIEHAVIGVCFPCNGDESNGGVSTIPACSRVSPVMGMSRLQEGLAKRRVKVFPL